MKFFLRVTRKKRTPSFRIVCLMLAIAPLWLTLAAADTSAHAQTSDDEDYNAETGEGLAPTPEQSPGRQFAGFVGWNMLALDMLQCEVTKLHCMYLELPSASASLQR